MDDKDKDIIRVLEREGRIKLSKLAGKVELPVTTVFNRIKKMEKMELIKPTIKLDKKQLGYGVEFFIMIKLDTSKKDIDQEALSKRLLSMKNITDVSIVTGSIDLIARAVTRDIDELTDLVLKKLRGIEGVVSTETIVVMQSFHGKDTRLL